ncbi:MAG: hypothetical protein E6J65_10435 [Deltaproteobacteria bacterium]|nr:MAG: hypothetical protein E6J65_10435 [Deltaproteobacteria bacterium]
MHRCAPALALLFRRLPLRFRVGDLLPELLHFLDELLELLRVLLRLRALLLQRLETCPELLKLAMQTIEEGADAPGRAGRRAAPAEAARAVSQAESRTHPESRLAWVARACPQPPSVG